MDFMTLANNRYSVRSFKEDKVEQDKIDQIIKAGIIGPSAANKQPVRVKVLTSNEDLDKLKKCTPYHYNAPLAIIVMYDKTSCWVRKYDNKLGGEVDASIFTTHMMLEAQDLGIGSVWVMSYDPKALINEYNLPSNLESVAILVMGYPSDNAKASSEHTDRKDLKEIIL